MHGHVRALWVITLLWQRIGQNQLIYSLVHHLCRHTVKKAWKFASTPRKISMMRNKLSWDLIDMSWGGVTTKYTGIRIRSGLSRRFIEHLGAVSEKSRFRLHQWIISFLTRWVFCRWHFQMHFLKWRQLVYWWRDKMAAILQAIF